MRTCVFFIMVLLLADDSVCRTRIIGQTRTAVGIVIDAELIVRAKAVAVLDQKRRYSGKIQFKIIEVLKGRAEDEFLTVEGYLYDSQGRALNSDDSNDAEDEGEAYSSYFTDTYIKDSEYLLFIREGSPYWSPRAMTNSGVHGPDDSWLLWVKAFLRKDLSKIPELRKWTIDPSFENECLYYDTNQYELSDVMKTILDKKILTMKAYPEISITIEGHCDEKGEEAYNYSLGLKRAENAKKYMVREGVRPERIKVISYGELRPVDIRQNEEVRQKNRRIKVKTHGDDSRLYRMVKMPVITSRT